ncbi:MAG: putative porin [Xanthobacteraceae bacterium]
MLRRSLLPFGAALCGLALACPAAAQDAEGTAPKRPTVSREAPPSPNSTINLINLLVKNNVITGEQAAALIKQADDEAYVARQAVRNATVKADGAEKTAAAAADAVSPPGTKHVTYVPEVVKKQLREEIKKEVMAKAQDEHWASPGTFPEWVSRIRFYGDVRTRYEGDFFPKGNVSGQTNYMGVNYNAINTGAPYNIGSDNPYLWPQFDTSQDRNREQIRARFGLDADLYDGFSAGIRLGTGDSNGPVSANQTLGGAGGDFSNYNFWLDRAFLRYSPWSDLVLNVGRFDNPFFTATDLVFWKDLGFDGIAAQAKHEIAPGFTPFVVAGAFPVFNTALNAQTTNFLTSADLPSHDKYLLAAQAGFGARFDPQSEWRMGVAYYDYLNVQGQLSDVCTVLTSADTCSTDLTRPSFAQRGNSYMVLRNILPIAGLPSAGGNESGNVLQYQYFGLASQFRPLVASSRLDLGNFDPVHIVLDGEYVVNAAFNRAQVAASVLATSVLIPSGPISNGQYVGGNQGWLTRMTVGYREIKALGDWNAFVGYKWLESDATLDALTDIDFGLGGTNLKGYFLGANLGVGPNVWLTAKWMSANQVAGAPYAVDILQIDLNGRF